MGARTMKIRYLGFAFAALALGGCSTSGMLEKMGMGGGKPAPATTTVQSGNPLAMPPDLRLKQPGAVADTYQPNTVAGEPVEQQTAAAQPVDPAPAAPQGDVYEQYGISKTKPDGTAKTQQELKAELKIAVRKKKQEANPGYGTFRNFGSIFSDG
jgi:hypothetical protein